MQVTVFLSVLNLAQWLVFTFEMQKVTSGDCVKLGIYHKN